jgi:cyanophycinase
MIAFGDEGSSVIAGSVRLAPGLGLTNRFVIDQHFRERDRLGRLITALAYNPFAIGIGLDEDTAVFIGPDETLEVEGSGGVTGGRRLRREFLVRRQRVRGAAGGRPRPSKSTS